jgi:DNA-binding NarL/FixJ family response regulator
MPQLLFELVRDMLAREPDITLAEGPESPDALAEAVAREGADVVITGQATPAAIALCERLARARPSVRVISLPQDGRDANALEQRVCVDSLGNVSPAQLVAAIRRPPASSTVPEHP